MREQINRGEVSAVDVWRKLASFDDSYAKSALEVIDRPGSPGWHVVRAIWDKTEADFGKFDRVANRHAQNYISTIEANPKDDRSRLYKLPTTRAIEVSYVRALGVHGLSKYTAIDVVIEKMIAENPSVSPPHWYNTPGVLFIERDRIEASDPALFRDMDMDKAFDVWLETGMGAAMNMDRTRAPRMEQALFAHRISDMLGGQSFSTSTMAGVSCYYNAETRNWAFFDQAGQGVASIDDGLIRIGPDNWRKDPDGNRFQIRMEEGWRTAELGPELPDHRQATATPLAASLPFDPRNPAHPDHAMYRQTWNGVREAELASGKKTPDQATDQMAASLFVQAKRSGLTEVNHVVFSQAGKDREGNVILPNQYVFAVQGELNALDMKRAMLPSAQAAATPEQDSFQQLASLNRDLERQQAQQRAQALEQSGQDAPARGGPKLS
ncbi:MAG: hypothetical protein LBL59_09335 [Xanthomonadaceae bacterium]|nr:hypothetical protein [Xanthomonadaceae bacterium]